MAPPIRMNSARGRLIRPSTVPKTRVSPVMRKTSQGRATNVNWSPSKEMMAPAISQT